MYKYEMDPASIVEDTERTGGKNNMKPVYPAFNLVELGSIIRYEAT